MEFLKELVRSFKTIGFCRTVSVIGGRIADSCFDTWYGLDTARRHDLDSLDIESESLQHATKYQPTGILPFKSLLRKMKFSKDLVFLDIGCGKGRVLLLASSYGFKTVRGIEFSGVLCEAARKNSESYKRKKKANPEIEIIEGDVNDYAFRGDENIFYFFDVFDDVLMEKTISRIVDSLQRNPREAWIIYLHPRLSELLDKREEFKQVEDSVIGGYEWKIYKFWV